MLNFDYAVYEELLKDFNKKFSLLGNWYTAQHEARRKNVLEAVEGPDGVWRVPTGVDETALVRLTF